MLTTKVTIDLVFEFDSRSWYIVFDLYYRGSSNYQEGVSSDPITRFVLHFCIHILK